MNIIFWGKGNRGLRCLEKLRDKKIAISLAVCHPLSGSKTSDPVADMAKEMQVETVRPEDPNTSDFEGFLKNLKPDLFILAGYGKILKYNIIKMPRIMCINLHGGKLPQFRGSSPLNWALIKGKASFTLSIIRVDKGVDTGDILLERTFKIGRADTIRDLHRVADEEFPEMLMEALAAIKKGSYALKKQKKKYASYYPLRFPDDGLILWDIYTAEEVHNRIRALTEPYPCAYTFFNERKVRLLASELYEYPYYGEPGRVYMKTKKGILVCASDKCLWVKKALFEDNGESLHETIRRYDKLSTVREAVEKIFSANSGLQR